MSGYCLYAARPHGLFRWCIVAVWTQDGKLREYGSRPFWSTRRRAQARAADMQQRYEAQRQEHRP